MSAVTEENVRPILQGFEYRLRAVIDRAWAEWMECDLRGRLIFQRAKSDVIFDFIARHALAEFGEDPDIHVIAKNSTVRFLFRDQVLVRFKKGNAKGVGSNIETQATLDYIDPQRTLPGLLAEVFRVEVCYQPDRLGTQLKDVAVVARDRTRRIWAYPLNPQSSAEIIPMRLPEPEPDESRPVATPRKRDDDAEKAD